MEYKIKNKTLIIAFFGFLAIVAAGIAAVILTSEFEVSAVTAGNSSANLMNGGFVLEDNGFLFYVNPGNGDLYRATLSQNQEKIKIAENVDGNLQRLGGRYYFTRGTDLYASDLEGIEELVLSGVKNPLVVGAYIYYADETGQVFKYREKMGEKENTGLTVNGQFLLYTKLFYYIGGDGLLHRCRENGSEDAVISAKSAKRFMIVNNHIFYETPDGKVYSTDTFGNADEDELWETDCFSVIGNLMMFVDNANDDVPLIVYDLNKQTYSKFENPGIRSFHSDGDSFYAMNESGALNRVNIETGKLTEIK